MAHSYHDENHIPTLLAVSSSDGQTPVVVWADPTTHRLLVSSTGGTVSVYTETPSGDIDGTNKVFTTVNTINNIFSFAINGQFLHPYSNGVGDYTFSGDTITFETALPAYLSGTAFTITYQ